LVEQLRLSMSRIFVDGISASLKLVVPCALPTR
jgi:hypothetical protein